MSSSSMETTQALPSSVHRNQVDELATQAAKKFKSLVRKDLWFHLAFFLLALLEIISFFLLFNTLIYSSLAAISLAILFFTLFTYIACKLTLQHRKPDALLDWRDDYFQACRALFFYPPDSPEYHLSLADGATKLASKLEGAEYTCYSLHCLPRESLERFSCWRHWEDVLVTRELLLQSAIDELLAFVRCEPTSLEAHITLANAYVTLSSLYADLGQEGRRWQPSSRHLSGLDEQFRSTAERAIEEFKILQSYAPHDPWVYAQLAYSYHDLGLLPEEIKAYETMLSLQPEDHDTRFTLGIRYFQLGLNGKGLTIYEALKTTDPMKAQELIRYYGSYEP